MPLWPTPRVPEAILDRLGWSLPGSIDQDMLDCVNIPKAELFVSRKAAVYRTIVGLAFR
jgi:hypothetical protein